MADYDIEWHIEQFKLDNPFIGKKIVGYYKSGPIWLTIELDDGRKILYDYLFDMSRYLPENSYDMTEEEFNIEFGLRLKGLMLNRRITQNQLADILGVSQGLISKYINGKINPDFYTLRRMSKILRCSVKDLIYEED